MCFREPTAAEVSGDQANWYVFKLCTYWMLHEEFRLDI